MVRKIEDFLDDWSYESEVTINILNAIPDDVLYKPVIGYSRTLGFLAWHIVGSIVDTAKMGLEVDVLGYDDLQPKKISEIIDIYKKTSDKFLSEIKMKWNDGSLNIENNMYGEMQKNGSTLDMVIAHQIHHRGQMTVLMRLLGLKKVPGVYGPSREEWVTYGMEPQP